MSEGEVVVDGKGAKLFQGTFMPPSRGIVSPEGDIGQNETENGEIESDRALENAIRDARQETLRVLLEKLKQVARKIFGEQFSLKEIETFERALVGAVGALGSEVPSADDPTLCSSMEEENDTADTAFQRANRLASLELDSLHTTPLQKF